MEIINFQKTDLLTGKELISLFTAVSPVVKAKIVSNKLIKYMFIDKSENFYCYRSNITYTGRRLSDDTLTSIVAVYISDSYYNLDEDSINMLKMPFVNSKPKEYNMYVKSNLSISTIKTYEMIIKGFITDENILVDSYTWQLHFQNGYINLKTGEFKKRVFGKDYVSYCIPRDYKPSTEANQNEIMKHIKKIYPNKEDEECIFSEISRYLIGCPNLDQNLLFLMGNGSSGKSLIASLLQISLNGYVELLPSDLFENGNPKRDKILNEFCTKKYILIAWINEFTDKKLSDSDIKNFCDGVVKTTRLYHDGTQTINLKCKGLFTTNHIPNIIINSGSQRRINSFEHKSKFSDEVQVDDWKKLHFKKDKYLLEKIRESNDLLNAIIDILTKYCILNWTNKAPPLSKNFKDTTANTISTNDIIADFVSSTLIVTNNIDKDRIGKEEMKKIFERVYPNKHLSIQQLITSLKEKGISYDGKLRCNKIQGCYVGVKIRLLDDDIDDDEEEFVEEKVIKPIVKPDIKPVQKKQVNKVEIQKPVTKITPKQKEIVDKLGDIIIPYKSLNKKKVIDTTIADEYIDENEIINDGEDYDIDVLSNSIMSSFD